MFHHHNATTLYVSPSVGEDRAYNGLSATPDSFGNGPLKTIDKALVAVRQMRNAGNRRPLRIALTEDVYLDHPIELADSLVTLTSCGGRHRLIGGVRVTGWKRDRFNGVDCLSAVLPTRNIPWDFTDFVVNGQYAAAPRFPKSGTLRALDTEDNRTDLFASSRWFIANPADLADVQGIEDALVNYLHFWIDEQSPVESYDPQTGKLVMQYASRFAISTQYEPSEDTSALRYYLTNIPTMFGQPNEWYLDRKTGTVYYVPADDTITPDTIDAYAPTVDHLINVTADDVSIERLELFCTKADYVSRIEHCTETDPDGASPDVAYASDGQSVCAAPGAIRFDHVKRSRLTDCYLHHVGIHAVEIRPGCDGVRIERNEMADIAGGGVKLIGGKFGCDERQVTAHCIVRGNHIHHLGRRFAAGCGVLVCHASDNEIADNEIHHLEYTGISVGWVWGYADSSTFGNLIRGNHIHHIGVGRLSDMGGIYLLGNQPGTVVCENRIHDVTSAHYGGWGIYADEGSGYITFERNVVYNTKCESFHMHYGCHNVVRNNVFAFGQGCIRISLEEMHDGVLFENNILLTNGAPIYGDLNQPQSMEATRNLIWDMTGTVTIGKTYDLDTWQTMLGKDRGSLVADPAFTDPTAFDFTLPADSPAMSVGFEPLTGFLATGKR